MLVLRACVLFKGILLALLLGPSIANGNNISRQIEFRDVLKNSGIALGEINAIIQDPNGFIWLGGRNGLLRFDGQEFTRITISQDSQSKNRQKLSVSHTKALFIDRKHQLWVATHVGLFRLDINKNTLSPLNSSNPEIEASLRIMTTSIKQTQSGKLVVSGHAGLILFDPETMDGQVFRDLQNPMYGRSGNAVFDFALGSQNEVWLGTEKGLTKLNLKSKQARYFTPYPEEPNSITRNSIKIVEKDKHGKIWLGTENGLYRFDPLLETFTPYLHDPNNPNSISDNASRALHQDSKGWLWYGSRSGGLNIYDFQKDAFVRVEHLEGQYGSLATNSVVSIYEDNIGDIWVGTYPSGANFHDRSSTAIKVYQRSQNTNRSLMVDNVGTVLEDKEGNIWVGAGGVSKINRKDNNIEHFSPEPNSVIGAKSIASGAILSGLQDSSGDIWFGSWAAGLQKYSKDEKVFKQLPYDTSISRVGPKIGTVLNDNVVWSLYEDRAGIIWLGTHHGGLNRYDPHTGIFTYYREDPEDSTTLSNQIVWTTLEDSKGRFWVGTSNGLNLLDRKSGKFTQYYKQDNEDSLQNNSILSIYEDEKKRLWFGTDSGLHQYIEEKNTFKHYIEEDISADNGIRSIVEDNQGNLWMGTNNGIRMFNPDTKVKKNFQSINRRQMGGFDTGSAIKTSHGELVFGGENGLKIIEPEKLTQSFIRELPLALTDFSTFTKTVEVNGPDKILTKNINETKSITLDYSKSMFSFRYAALNFRNPDKSLYAYMLEGFDDSWREVGTQKIATYTNIPPGNYTFKIKAKSTSNGHWTTKKTPVKLIIKPPPWRTWWAYIGYVLLVAMVFYFREKYRYLRKSAEQYKTQSITDALTKAYNREGITQITEQLYKNPEISENVAILMIDIDHFKRVNDRWGHDIGDYVLCELARTISKNIRESDYLGRWGGEEMLLICPESSPATAELVAEKIRRVISENIFENNSQKLAVTVSIGVAITNHNESFEEVFKRADTALYQAKFSGRNCIVMSETSNNTPPDKKIFHSPTNFDDPATNA